MYMKVLTRLLRLNSQTLSRAHVHTHMKRERKHRGAIAHVQREKENVGRKKLSQESKASLSSAMQLETACQK